MFKTHTKKRVSQFRQAPDKQMSTSKHGFTSYATFGITLEDYNSNHAVYIKSKPRATGWNNNFYQPVEQPWTQITQYVESLVEGRLKHYIQVCI